MLDTVSAFSSSRAAVLADARFMRKSMSIPFLTREGEVGLSQRWRAEGDLSALHRLVGSHARLVVATANRFRRYGLPITDLVQEGHVGLMLAATRFDPDRGVRFSTYAAWWIRSSLQEYVLRNWSIVRTGTTAAQRALFFGLRRLKTRIDPSGAALTQEGRARVAQELSVPETEVVQMEQRLRAGDQSLNAQLGEDGDLALQDLLVDDRPTPEQIVLDRRSSTVLSRMLADAVAQLSPRERVVIHERRLNERSATLEELGRELGVSKERVRQLEVRALGKLRKAMILGGAVAADIA